MSEYQILTILAAFAFLYSLIASGLERTPVSGAIVYLFCGLACGPQGLQLIQLDVDAEGLRRLAEFTLAVVLFCDSAEANLGVLKRIRDIPIRLLLFGLPLTIAMGYAFGYLLFEDLGVFEIALLATILAPTDAALGQAVVTNDTVPASIRESLNVESGLNDGICVPVLLTFLALATGSVSENGTLSLLLKLPLQQIGVGVAVGLTLAIVGSVALRFCSGRGWIAGSWVQIPIVALAMLCFASAQWLGGSGFIAAFVGGLIFGGLTKRHKDEILAGAESTGNVLSLLMWFAYGTVAFGQGFGVLNWKVLVYAILSLTVVRMLPVYLVAGAGQHRDTKLFLGWFGPRGLASIVFIVMVMDAKLPGNDTLMAVANWTVTLSIILHGLTAIPLANLFSKRVNQREGAV